MYLFFLWCGAIFIVGFEKKKNKLESNLGVLFTFKYVSALNYMGMNIIVFIIFWNFWNKHFIVICKRISMNFRRTTIDNVFYIRLKIIIEK